MTYAYVVAGTVQSTGNIPQTWRLLDGRWCSGFDLRPDLWQAQGWLPLTENRPAVTLRGLHGGRWGELDPRPNRPLRACPIIAVIGQT